LLIGVGPENFIVETGKLNLILEYFCELPGVGGVFVFFFFWWGYSVD